MGQIQDRPDRISDVPAYVSLLIVDDVAETRENIKKILQFEPRIRIVGEARTGQEALWQFNKLLPNAVIMGINMPGGDGIEATEYMCRSKADANIIILTCQNTPEYRSRAFKAGARYYITKPPNPDELVKSIIILGSKQGVESSTR